ncbi:MAG: class IIb bacteriocin, lactobin A/cerein 7B family [Candidatus Berkiellales bacterium]
MRHLNQEELVNISGGAFSIGNVITDVKYAVAGGVTAFVVSGLPAESMWTLTLNQTLLYSSLLGLGAGLVQETANFVDEKFLGVKPS